jgi:hypothetical protein
MEPRFGHDFSGVRVHTDSRAAESARAVGAHAYTVGEGIVFDQGQYNPHTYSGQRLLAHELAHTIQQQGIQRSAARDLQLDGSTQYARLEREADLAADTALRSASPAVPASSQLLTHASAPIISRQTATTLPATTTPVTPPATATTATTASTTTTTPATTAAPTSAPANQPEGEGRGWHPLAAPVAVGQGQQATARAQLGIGTVAFKIDKFMLPPGKGPVLDMYQDKAKAGALEATIDFSGDNPRAGLWQQREVSAGLRENWMLKVGWTAANAADKWHQAGGPAPTAGGFPKKNPRVTANTCDMDHVVELQLGGSNVPSNIQVLDSKENQDSGRGIWDQVSGIAKALRDTLPANQRPSEVVLHFDMADGAPPTKFPCAAPGTAASCLQVEHCAASGAQAAAATGGTGATATETQTLEAGAATAAVQVKPAPSSTDLLGSGPLNLAASELIPGALLQAINRPAAAPGAQDIVMACIESDTCFKRGSQRKTRTPISLKGETGLQFLLVDKDGKRRLRLSGDKKNVKFAYPYLSEGKMDISLNEAGEVVGVGTLKPSLPLLSKSVMKVKLAPGEFSGSLTPKASEFKIFPGVRIVKPEIGIELSPAFRPYGTLGFEVGPKGKPILDGSVTAEADTSGFFAHGQINAYLPGVDQAQGKVEYRNGRWKGEININSTQIKLPMIQSASLRVDFTDEGATPSGSIVLGLPGGQTVELGVKKEGALWVYTGSGEFKVPHLKPVKMHVRYDGKHITASGQTGFSLAGLDGDIKVDYNDGRFSGVGKLHVKKKKAVGDIEVKMSPAYKFSGQGKVTYTFSENLIGTAGIILNEDGSVRLMGAIEIPKPIPLFKAFQDKKTLWEPPPIKIPIPGASIGGIGLNVVISGSLGYHYKIGPGQLENVKIEAAFSPLEDDPDIDITAGAKLSIPAEAGLSARIKAGLSIDAFVASVSGNIIVTGSATLRGGASAEAKVHYTKQRFSFDAAAAIEAGLILGLSLDASVEAKAGFGWLSVSTEKVWNLASYQYDTGLKAGMKAKFHYASDEPFKAPSLNDIEWITPNLDGGKLINSAFDNASNKETEK